MADTELNSLEDQFASELLASWSESGDDNREERRKSIRRSYPYVQLVAPRTAANSPSASEFHEVRCRDLSSRGFSFLSRRRPAFDELVVGFGTTPNLMYIEASVVHVTPTMIEGQSMFLVGCCYHNRANFW